jgi:hypothetical protein
MEPTGDEIERFGKAVDRLGYIASAWNGEKTGTSEAVINVHAGGWGVWIASTCCAVMLAITIAGSILGTIGYFSMQQRMDRMQDYLNAIYVIAPNLRPKDSK